MGASKWLGNTTQSGDDVGGFYDRSLGTITNGGTGAGPYQLTGASGGTSPRQGSLVTAYDGAGNLTGMNVARPSASCVPTGAVCSQRYAYDWDEVGRLMRARRWDGASLGAPTTALPTATPAVDLGYAYDMSDSRTLKTATDALGNQVSTVYVYDDLELRRAAWSGTDYDDTVDTEVPYLFTHGVRLARVEYSTTDPSPDTHVILELQDQLGSTTIAIDQGTSELVERGTYLGYGGADSDYRPSTWGGFREDYRFTGKEEDVEVGLDYFGKRFYAPLLGRWISADPLAVASPGRADLNVYAYVHGAVVRAVDLVGLQEAPAVDWRSEHVKSADMIAVGRGLAVAWNGFRAWLTDKVFDRAAYDTAVKGRPPVPHTPMSDLVEQIVQATPVISGMLFLELAGNGAGVTVRPIPSAVPRLNEILGETFTRLEGRYNEGTAMRLTQREATIVVKGYDPMGNLQTIVATANREVYKTLMETGVKPGETLLPFVARTSSDAAHPDVVAAQYAKSQGLTEANFATKPNMCPGCKEQVPQEVPGANIETPANPPQPPAGSPSQASDK